VLLVQADKTMAPLLSIPCFHHHHHHHLLYVQHLILGIANTLSANGKLRIAFGKSGTVHDAANAILATALAQTETSGRSVRNNVASNRLGGVLGETHSVRIRYNLVGDKDGDAKLFGQASQLTKELSHLHLAFAEFTSTHVVRAEESRGAVNDQESVAILSSEGIARLV
jgi:hypothetical protein